MQVFFSLAPTAGRTCSSNGFRNRSETWPTPKTSGPFLIFSLRPDVLSSSRHDPCWTPNIALLGCVDNFRRQGSAVCHSGYGNAQPESRRLFPRAFCSDAGLTRDGSLQPDSRLTGAPCAQPASPHPFGRPGRGGSIRPGAFLCGQVRRGTPDEVLQEGECSCCCQGLASALCPCGAPPGRGDKLFSVLLSPAGGFCE